jgi:hypothetical protein
MCILIHFGTSYPFPGGHWTRRWKGWPRQGCGERFDILSPLWKVRCSHCSWGQTWNQKRLLRSSSRYAKAAWMNIHIYGSISLWATVSIYVHNNKKNQNSNGEVNYRLTNVVSKYGPSATAGIILKYEASDSRFLSTKKVLISPALATNIEGCQASVRMSSHLPLFGHSVSVIALIKLNE